MTNIDESLRNVDAALGAVGDIDVTQFMASAKAAEDAMNQQYVKYSDEAWRGLPYRIISPLQRKGIVNPQQLRSVANETLLGLRGIGPSAVREIRDLFPSDDPQDQELPDIKSPESRGVTCSIPAIEWDPDTETRGSVMRRIRMLVNDELTRVRNERKPDRSKRSRDIYEEYRAGGVTYADLARRHGVSTERIRQHVAKGKRLERERASKQDTP